MVRNPHFINIIIGDYLDSLSKKDESKLDAFTSLLESFGGLDLDEPPEIEDTEIVKLSVKEKTESEKLQDELEPISEEKIVDEVKVDNSSSEPQLKLSNKDQEKLSSFAGLMESFGALLDEPPQLEDEKVFEMKIEDVYPEENKEKIEEKKKVKQPSERKKTKTRKLDMQLMPIFKPIQESEAKGKVKEIYDEIKTTRQITEVPNFWKMLANDPNELDRTWNSLKDIMKKNQELVKSLLLNYSNILLAYGNKQELPIYIQEILFINKFISNNICKIF